VSFDGDLADRVIKLTHGYEWAILVEKYLFPDMKSRGLPVPEIEYTHEDYGGSSEPFIIMPKFSDHRLMDSEDLGRDVTERASRSAAHFIHDLDDVFGDAFESYRDHEDMIGQLAATQKIYDESLPLQLDWLKASEPELAQSIQERLLTLDKSAKQLHHGAFATQNVLCNTKGEICVIDLGESIKKASPLLDLCMLLLGSHFGGEDNTRWHIAAMVEGYGGLSDDEVRELKNWELHLCAKGLQGVKKSYNEVPKRLVDRLQLILSGESLLATQLAVTELKG